MTTSKACCTIPPVVDDTDTYTVKGRYTTLDGMRVYVTGADTAKRGVLMIYDIFGMDLKQTLQGADLIATGTNSLVVMPDLFRGEPFDPKNFPPDTPEKQKLIGEFFSGPAAPGPMVAAIQEKVLPSVKGQFSGVEKWGVVGYCWGGKIVSQLSGAESQFAAAAQIHPAFLDPADAAKITIPHFVLATKDEDAAIVEAYKTSIEGNDAIKAKSSVLRWDTTFHGFMAGRANLKDQSNLEHYEKGYKKLVHFLNEAL